MEFSKWIDPNTPNTHKHWLKNMYSISKLWGKTTCLRIQTEGLGMFRPFKIRVLWGTVSTSLRGVVVGFAITWQHVNMLDSTKRKSGQRLGIITSATYICIQYIYIYDIYIYIYIRYIYDIYTICFFKRKGKSLARDEKSYNILYIYIKWSGQGWWIWKTFDHSTTGVYSCCQCQSQAPTYAESNNRIVGTIIEYIYIDNPRASKTLKNVGPITKT